MAKETSLSHRGLLLDSILTYIALLRCYNTLRSEFSELQELGRLCPGSSHISCQSLSDLISYVPSPCCYLIGVVFLINHPFAAVSCAFLTN
jgi:hypothetical protein